MFLIQVKSVWIKMNEGLLNLVDNEMRSEQVAALADRTVLRGWFVDHLVPRDQLLIFGEERTWNVFHLSDHLVLALPDALFFVLDGQELARPPAVLLLVVDEVDLVAEDRRAHQ